MPKKSLIEIIYDYLMVSKKNHSFDELWKVLKIDTDPKNADSDRAELYTDLVLDNRFALTFDGKWGLRDLLKYEDVKKQYEYVDKFVTTEEFDSTSQYSDTQDQTRVIDISKKVIESEMFAGYDDEDLLDDEDEDTFEESEDFSEDFDDNVSSEGFE